MLVLVFVFQATNRRVPGAPSLNRLLDSRVGYHRPKPATYNQESIIPKPPGAGFWGEKSMGWHYDLLFITMNLVIFTTGGGRIAVIPA